MYILFNLSINKNLFYNNNYETFSLAIFAAVAASDILGEEKILIGNIDPTDIFLMGDKNIIDKSVENLCKKMQGKDNFILSSGCDIPLNTPIENIKFFREKGREYLKKYH